MNCEQIAELLPDYLQGNLSREQSEMVEAHCQSCATCLDEVAVWKKLSLLPSEQPSTESRARFEAMLHAYPTASADQAAVAAGLADTKRASSWSTLVHWFRSPLGAVAWSAALLVIGVFVGMRLGNADSSGSRSQELAAMHSELTNMRQLVVLSMLQQQSAGERLQGVSWSSRDDHLDPQVQSALLHTLRFDGSVDVRLAALDALSRHASQPQIRKGVVDTLQEQQSPLVQVALIDLLAEWRDPDATQRLRNFQQTANLNPIVRQRAEWAVSKLQ
jgi:anti-sigma factor RsiW